MALELYKPEEATRSRGLLAVLICTLLGYGIYSLYDWLTMDFWQKDLVAGVLGDEFPISPRVLLCGLLLVALGISSYLVCNHQRVVDFLIDTENELQKVSWSPKHEVISSSVVVVATVIILGIFMGLVDYFLVIFKDWIPWSQLWDRILGG